MAQVSFTGNVGKTPDWLALQIRIFTRWVNQKLAVRSMQIKDIIHDVTGEVLKNLIEILSEKAFPGKALTPAPKLRVQQIDNASRALKFAEDSGVMMELKCSPENLVDGTEKQVLGLVWAIMRRFMKFGNDDTKVKATDALLMWVKNQVVGYKHAEVKDFNNSFKNGMVLCALLHKFRPKLVNYDTLNPSDFEKNLKTAFKAANQYFGLDEYLTPAEIQKLDDKSMVVYVSEYYSGIAAQRKLDVAARRISKLIASTKHNDELRQKYVDSATRLKTNLKVAESVLLDRKVDNNLAGAQKRLDEFYSYQTKEKSLIINDYLSIESLYNQLSLKLADHKRPAFVPPAGLELPALRTAFQPLEQCERERNVALHNEVHRQTELLVLNGQHIGKHDKLSTWTVAKQKYLVDKEKVETSGAAEYQLNRLAAYNSEADATKKGTASEMFAIGKKLLDEKFEKANEVAKREDDVKSSFVALDAAAALKGETLKDDLAREQLRERISLTSNQHLIAFNALKGWLDEKEKQLSKKETVESVREARVFLDHIALYARARNDLDAALGAFRQLGADICAAKHESKYSQWSFPTQDEIKGREKFVDEKLAKLAALYVAKKETLEDDLAREQFKEKLLLRTTQHATEGKSILAWADEKKAFLEKKELVQTVKDARAALNLLDTVAKAKADMLEANVASLKTLGKEILESKYESKLSTFSSPDVDAVRKREDDVDSVFTTLEALYQNKLAVLSDDLAREDFREKIVLYNEQHVGAHAVLKTWIDAKEEYLKIKEDVKSVRDASVALAKLSAYEKAKHEQTETTLAAYKKLGGDILNAKYETKISTYVFHNPAEVQDREKWTTGKWAELDTLHADKLAVLQDDLAREEFREKLVLSNQQHADTFANLKAWIAEREAFLNKKEPIESVRDARGGLNLLDIYDKSKADMTAGNVAAFHKLTRSILEAKYETKHSGYVWHNPAEVKERDDYVAGKWKTLDELYANKLAVLRDDLAREEFKERVLLQNSTHVNAHNALQLWINEREAYLNRKEPVESVRDARAALSVIDMHNKSKSEKTQGDAAAFHKLTRAILDARYETKLSTYAYDKLDEVKARDQYVLDKWVLFDALYAAKLAVLQDDLAREEFKDKTTLANKQHIEAHAALKAWIEDKEAFLGKKEVVDNVASAKAALTLMTTYDQAKAEATAGPVTAFHRLTAAILSAKYETKHSQYVWGAPQDVKARDAYVVEKWSNLDVLSAAKLAVLQDDLAREEFREKVTLMVQQHANAHRNLAAWIQEKETYLKKKEAIDNVKDAKAALNVLEIHHTAQKEMSASTVAGFSQLTAEILGAKYETKHSQYAWAEPAEIKKLETYVLGSFLALGSLYTDKLAVLQDDLAREEFKEKVVLANKQHVDAHIALKAWIEDKEAFLNKKEVVDSVRDARGGLSLLDIYDKSKADMTTGNVAAFHKLTRYILDAKYETKHSGYVWQNPAEVKERDDYVVSKWSSLDVQYAAKHAVLTDDLAREVFREKLLLTNQQHVGSYASLKSWIDAKEAYLKVKESVQNVKEARVQLNLIDVYAKDKKEMTAANLPAFKKLGRHVLEAKYETKHSSYVFPTPGEVNEREKWVDEKWSALDNLYAEKLRTLQDDLAREDFRERVELKNEQHDQAFAVIKAWIAEKEAYLNKKEVCDSVRASQVQLNVISVYEKDKAALTAGNVAAFHKLGKDILGATYKNLSAYSFPKPEDVKSRLDFVSSKWHEFDGLYAHKLAVLQDDLAREEFKERTLLANNQHVTSFTGLKTWIADKEAYLDSKENIDSVQDARVALDRLAVFDKDKQNQFTVDVSAFKKLGKEVLDAKYETKISTYTFENRNEVTEREAFVDSKFDVLAKGAATKKAALEAAFASETAKEKARVDFASLANDARRWATDTIEAVNVRAFGFSLKQVEGFGKTMAASDAEIGKTANERKVAYTVVFNEGVKLGVNENKYTSNTVAELDTILDGVRVAQEARVKAYEAELATQQANDALCKKFADLVTPFVATLQKNKDAIGASTATMEVQLQEIDHRIADGKTGEALPAIKELADKISAAKVQSNPHTLLSYKDVEVQWAQYRAFLERKKQQIQTELENKKLRGVTPAQMAEIEKQFKQYDANNNKTLELGEFKACLYSLGNDYAAIDLKKIMHKWGGSEASISYEGFKNFMVSLYGDTDTKDEILAGFKMLNKGKPAADPKQMELLPDSDLKYMMEKAPKNPDGTYNYNKFVDDLFSR